MDGTVIKKLACQKAEYLGSIPHKGTMLKAISGVKVMDDIDGIKLKQG